MTTITTYQPPTDSDAPIRTSSLTEPTMHLTGHKGSVYALSFDPTGESLVSGSFDCTCLLWSASGSCDNYNVLTGHKNAILDLKWSADSEFVVTASADKNLGWFDACTGNRIKRFMGHDGIVNAVDISKSTATTGGSSSMIVSGSDDGTARVWDARVRGATMSMEHDYPVTAVALSNDGKMVYTGGLDNCIYAWDVRKQQSSGEKVMCMKGHGDTITCLSVSPDGNFLLSNSMDQSIRSWDIRPFVEGNNRLHKTFVGGTHNAEKGLLSCAWSADGSMVSGGSADRVVHVWDEMSGEELYYLPGHKGCVNTVIFHPKENVIASGSSDKSIFIGELSH